MLDVAVASRVAHDLLGRTVGRRYRIIGALAEGAMGTLYAAKDGENDVVVKVIRADLIDERFRRRFDVETQATRRLQSPHIVQLLDSGFDGDLPFLVLELLRGHDLHELLRAHDVLVWRDAARILHGIASALDVAHRGQVLHRDLKPRNIFLVDGDAARVKVLDFGIARILDDDGSNRPKTTTGHVLGTRGYIAPERLRGDAGDARSDLYALGTLAWDMVAGHGPFVAPTDILLSIKHLTERPPSLLLAADVPEALASLVGQLLEKEPARRPASAAAVCVALDALLSA